MELRVAGIVKESVVDGPGFRYVIFAQGCTHGCKGCHNPDTHALDGGYAVDTDSLIEDIKQSRYIDGVTFSGGEPLLQAEAFIHIAEKLKELNMNIVCYTGFTFEEIMQSKYESHIKLLRLTDMLIDGPYMEELKDLGLTYRGSKNQRIIDVKRSIEEQKVILERLYREAS
ncbi:MAG TPA: anaerobic ribonucleoside-triphosphate reductase activating protein [Clostridia bacterium]|nr:anaerobic ribonucleoside-triphosphate reductase activating protein [Clostridia bacterium]